jgi:curved DNA-binding protein
VEFKDYYQILGVPRDATTEAIKKAFRKLARKYHPDVSKEPGAEARMKEVNEAYTVLSDPEKRAAYDQLGRDYRAGQEFRPPPGWDAGFEFRRDGGFADAEGFSDFFSQLFGGLGGGAFRGGARGGPHGGMRGGFRAQGEDHRAKILLDVEDAFTGATRQITLKAAREDEAGRVVVEPRTLNVKIPLGVTPGQVIRLAGQGAPGRGGGPAGDLYLEVEFRPHSRYRVEGRDLHVTLPVAPWEAALGAQVPVESPAGSYMLRIPAGTKSGGRLRLRGKGLPAAGGQPAGDLIADVQVVLPPADTPRARELYETMARELHFDPRRT